MLSTKPTTNLRTSGCNVILVKSWMGHNLETSEDGYFVPDMESQRKAYSENYKALAFSSIIDREIEKKLLNDYC
jgi:hypothetical protein